MIRCVNHPEKDAKFQCAICHSVFCEDCIVVTESISCCKKCVADSIGKAHKQSVSCTEGSTGVQIPYPQEGVVPAIPQTYVQSVQPQYENSTRASAAVKKPHYNKYAGILLMSSGILGILASILISVFWGPYVLPFTGRGYPTIGEWVLLGLMIPFVLSLFGIIGGLLALNRRYFFIALLFGILSIFSWGFYIGMMFSTLAVILIVADYGNYIDFYPGQPTATKSEKRAGRRMAVRALKAVAVSALIVVPMFFALAYTGNRPGTNSLLLFDGSLYFSRQDISSDFTLVTVTGYLSNKGISDSGDVKVIVYLRDSNGMSEGKSQARVGGIVTHTTKEISASATLTKTTDYSVDLLIFENDRRVSIAQGSVRLVERNAASPPSQPNPVEDKMPGMATSAGMSIIGPFVIVGALVFAVIMILVFGCRKTKSTIQQQYWT